MRRGVDRRLSRLSVALGEIRELLLDYDLEGWVEWCDRCLAALDARSHDAPALVLSAFGGMGSLNDVVLSRPRGLRSAVEIAMQSSGQSESDEAANKRLLELKEVIHSEAMALEATWPRNDR